MARLHSACLTSLSAVLARVARTGWRCLVLLVLRPGLRLFLSALNWKAPVALQHQDMTDVRYARERPGRDMLAEGVGRPGLDMRCADLVTGS